MSDLADRILALVSKRNYQPLKAKALARKLGLPTEQHRDFRGVLKQLVQEGRLDLGKGNAIRPAQPHGTLIGVFRKAAAGHGFVRTHATQNQPAEEFFIPPDRVRDASTGDEVLVRLLKRPSRGADRLPGGEILRILERATSQFVGTYFERGGEGFVRVDGTAFNEPIYVGDPGAKGAAVDDKVVFDMIRFPSPTLRGEGVITEVLGPRGQPGVDTLSIIRAFELPDKFPDDVLEEARRQAAAFDESDLEGREDFTSDLVVTIDPADARDFDDAVSLSYDGHKKHWNLAVHIADVSHFAPAGSLLDREARNRGTSVYLPQRVLPMFPEIVSNSLASLQQGRVRYVKSALMEFTHAGQRVHMRFVEGAIRAAKRFTYDQVSDVFRLLDGGERAAAEKRIGRVEPHTTPSLVIDLLHRLREFALILRQRRHKRGSLELYLPETELEYDHHGRVTGAHLLEHDISHQIIEEFMLAANEAVAEHLASLGVPFLRRVHAPPDPRKLKDFAEFVTHLGYEVSARRATDRFQLQRVLGEAVGKPEVHAVHYALLRSLKQAEYGPMEEGHYALASDCYCHFTSPIRRYPDLSVHRLLGRLLQAGRAQSDENELAALGEHCSFTERRAEKAERELIKLKLLEYLRTRIGMELEIIITGVEDYGFFGQGEHLPVEGLVRVSSLPDDTYYYDALTHSLTGRRTKRRFRLGDRVKVQVGRVDVDRRRLDFRLADARRRGGRHER